MTDGLTVPANDDVALMHARLGSWSLKLHVHYHYTSSATLDGDKLEAEAEIAPRDVAVLLKSRRDTLNSSRRDNEDTAARSENRHADCPSRPINGETALHSAACADQVRFER